MFLRKIRQQLTTQLWHDYQTQLTQAHSLNRALTHGKSDALVLDHYAILDLPGPYTGIPMLQTLFEQLGYCVQGRDYLADKQNDFLWMAEIDCKLQPAKQVLPQVVLADFRLEALPDPVRTIVSYYAKFATAIPFNTIKTLLTQAKRGNLIAEQTLLRTLCTYLQHKNWPSPTLSEFKTVYQHNELLAWVLVFGRRINHFALSIHHLEGFANLATFNHTISSELKIPLYKEGIIKGSPEVQLEQSATRAPIITVPIADGIVQIPDRFVEFIWRHPNGFESNKKTPMIWQDYFVGFLGENADDLIETIYS